MLGNIFGLRNEDKYSEDSAWLPTWWSKKQEGGGGRRKPTKNGHTRCRLAPLKAFAIVQFHRPRGPRVCSYNKTKNDQERLLTNPNHNMCNIS